MNPPRSAAAAIAAALLALGCAGEKREPKADGTAIWVGASSSAPDLAVLERLAAQGVSDQFVEVARLSWEGTRPVLTATSPPRAPRRERTTLVVTGLWPGADLDETETAAALDAGIQGLRVEAERAGRWPIGVHFDLELPSTLSGFGETMRTLRRSLDEQLYLSASLAPADLVRTDVADAVAPLDFVVAFLYGQRPGQPEDAAAWDLVAVESRVRQLETLGRPYYLAAVTVGGATWRARCPTAGPATPSATRAPARSWAPASAARAPCRARRRIRCGPRPT